MPVAPRRALLTLVLAALAGPALAASQCLPVVGEGWPPAVGNYGQAATSLLGGQAEDGLSLLVLPARGVESQVLLRRDAANGQWMVLAGMADKRIYNWSTAAGRGGVNLQLDQEPEFAQAPLPEWGAMIADGRAFLADSWWLTLVPAAVVTIFCISAR